MKNKKQLATIKSGVLKGKNCLILNQFNTSGEKEMSLVQVEGQEIVIESSRLRKWVSVKGVSVKDGVVTTVPLPSEECEKINPIWRRQDTLQIVPGPDEKTTEDTFDMVLDNCPFCKANTVFEDGFVWHNKDLVRCGCQTIGCRGNINESPHYASFEDMWKKWNRRG